MDTVKVGVVGVGNIFKLAHFPAFQYNPEIELVALSDTNKDALARASVLTGVKKTYANPEEMLQKEKLDIFDICTYHNTHEALAKLGAKYKVNVTCEKPMCMTMREADAMVDACKKAGVKLFVMCNDRFLPITKVAKEIMEEDIKKDFVNVFAEYIATMDIFLKEGFPQPDATNKGLKPTTNWRDDPARYGSYAHDMGIHLFDMLRYVLGANAKKVYAELGALAYPNMLMEDNSVTLVRFDNDALGTFILSLSASEAFGFHRVEIHGVGRTILLKDFDFVGYSVAGKEQKKHLRDYKAWRKEFLVTKSYGNEGRNSLWGGYEEEWRYAAECVKKDIEPHNSGEDHKRSLEIAIATLKSAKEGRPITLPLASD